MLAPAPGEASQQLALCEGSLCESGKWAGGEEA